MSSCSETSRSKSGQTARRAFPGWGMVRRASSLWSTNPTPHGDELTEGGDPPTKRFRGTSPTDDNTHSVQHLCVYPGQRDGWDPSSISFHWRGRSCRRKGSRADFRPQVDQSKAPFAEHPLDPITADPLRLRGSFVRRRGRGRGDVCRGHHRFRSGNRTRCSHGPERIVDPVGRGTSDGLIRIVHVRGRGAKSKRGAAVGRPTATGRFRIPAELRIFSRRQPHWMAHTAR
jgi:hypothetical protein